MCHTKWWCSLGILKKTKCRNIGTEAQLDLPGAWLSWPPKPSCGRKRRLCEDPSRTCQEHFPPRRIPGRERVWRIHWIHFQLQTQPWQGHPKTSTYVRSKSFFLTILLTHKHSAFLNQRHQSNQNSLLLGYHFSSTPIHPQTIPPPKKKSSPSSPCNKYWSHSSVTFRRMRCRNSSSISQAAWGSSSLRRKTSKATATEVRGKRRRSSSTWKVVSFLNFPGLSLQQNLLKTKKTKKK